MWSFPKHKYSREAERGNIMVLFSVLTMIAILGSAIGLLVSSSHQVFQLKMTRSRTSVGNATAAETMVVAYRLAELKYSLAVSNAILAHTCTQANPFLVALKSGSSCPGLTINIWDSSDPTDAGTIADAITGSPMYTFPAGGRCTITQTASSCATGGQHVVDSNFNGTAMGGTSLTGSHGRQIASNYGYSFYLMAVRPEKEQIDFAATYTDNSNFTSKMNFTIKTDLPNAAHVDSDYKIVQENPDPLSECPGAPWDLFQVFVASLNKCVSFSKLGGTRGLVFYNNIYFGFNPDSGLVYDYLALAQGASNYQVAQDGTLSGVSVFPPYNAEQMRFNDDITTIANEIYYVGGVGPSATMGVFDPTSLVRKPICNLGAMGYGQAYAGIAALGMSDPLVPPIGGDILTSRLATFFLKTETGFSPPDTGPELTLLVLGNQAGTSFQCAIFKDKYLQVSEYTRTYGFDRTASSKPYYTF